MPRNVNGTYTLVSGNPVVTGTVIDSAWANDTMPDFGAEMTDSLSRSGKGGMLAPLRGVNGSAAVPSHSFTAFVQSGMYMAAAGDLQLSVTGVQKLRLSAGDTRPQYWSVSGATWLNVADSVDVTTLQANIDAEAVTRASQTGANASAIVVNADAITANAAAIVVNADGITANAAAIVVNADAITVNAGNTNDITTNDADIAANALAITLVGDIASIPARNTVLNQDPVSQGTATRSGMSSTIYTGNGGTQSVATGVDMNTGDFGGLVWIKSRGGAASHILVDSVRTPSQELFSSTTGVESSSTNRVDSLDSTGFSLGTSSGVSSLNANTDTYVAWSWQTTEKTTGTTNRNKAYTAHYNADLGFSIVGFIGDGVDGHEIPHFLGKEPELTIFKNRDAVNQWAVKSSLLDEDDYIYLNATSSLQNADNTTAFFSDTTIALDAWPPFNGSTNDIIAYNFTSIPNVCKIGTYIGSGASGNYVDCGFKAAWVMVKNLTAAGNWTIYDSSRSSGGLYLLANVSSAEGSGATLLAEFVDDGFVLLSNSVSVNSLNDEYIFMAYAEGTAFDSTKTLTNYPYATTDEVLTINSGTLMSFAEGFNAIGQANTQELVGAGVTLSFGAGYESQTRYVYKDKAGSYDSTQYRPLEGISRAQADKFGVVSPLDVATRTTDKHFGYESATGVALASGEFASAEVWKCFDKGGAAVTSDFIITSATSGWVQYKFVEPRVLKSWRMRENTVNVNRTPLRFTIQGSDDGFVWTAIDSTYTASDYVGNGLALWGGIQDTSANTTAYLYHRMLITSVNGGTDVAIQELEFNTITPSDYYNVVDGLVYNNAGTVIDRVYLAKIMTGASGELLNFENLPVAKIKGVHQELQGNSTVHGDISNRGVCTAWAVIDPSTNPRTILDSYNIADVVDIGVGLNKVLFEIDMDTPSYSIALSAAQANIGVDCNSTINTTRSFVFATRSSSGATISDSGNPLFLQVFGGKSI